MKIVIETENEDIFNYLYKGVSVPRTMLVELYAKDNNVSIREAYTAFESINVWKE